MRRVTFEKGPHSLVRAQASDSGATGLPLCRAVFGGISVRTLRLVQVVLATAVLALAVPLAADAQPRSGAPSQRQAPELPASGHQTEAIDLNEGKTPAQMFASDCAVCHQKAQGLAKGRNAGQLTSFLRQHYTTGVEQARAVAAFLTSGGNERGPAAAPVVSREAPDRPGIRERGLIDRPPAPIFGIRRPPWVAEPDDAPPEAAPGDTRRKPSPPAGQASRPAEREGGSRKPREETRKPPAAAAARAGKPAEPESTPAEAPVPAPETHAAPAAEPMPPVSAPQEKPAAPAAPVPEIRI